MRTSAPSMRTTSERTTTSAFCRCALLRRSWLANEKPKKTTSERLKWHIQLARHLVKWHDSYDILFWRLHFKCGSFSPPFCCWAFLVLGRHQYSRVRAPAAPADAKSPCWMQSWNLSIEIRCIKNEKWDFSSLSASWLARTMPGWVWTPHWSQVHNVHGVSGTPMWSPCVWNQTYYKHVVFQEGDIHKITQEWERSQERCSRKFRKFETYWQHALQHVSLETFGVQNVRNALHTAWQGQRIEPTVSALWLLPLRCGDATANARSGAIASCT